MMHVWEEHKHTECWQRNLREIDNLQDLFLDNRVTLKIIFKKYDGRGVWLGLMWLRIRTGALRCCECGTEHMGSIKCAEFLH
jgi:hypothetical protein